MCDPSHDEKKPPVCKTMPLTTEEPVRRPWLSDQLKDINLVDSADSPSPSDEEDDASPPPHVPIVVTPPQQAEATNDDDDDSEDTDMENELVSDDEESDDSEPTVVSPPTAPTTSIHPSSSKTTTATSSDMATAQGTAQEAKKNGSVPTQFLRHGSSQMDLLWNEMEQHQWDNADDGFWGEEDDDDSSDLDDELKKATEANRHIDVDEKQQQPPSRTKSMHDPTLRQLLVFTEGETAIQADQQSRTFVYGSGPTGDQGTDGAIGQRRRRRREYLIACDFSRESLHAMEWTMGTMLRDHDALHIVTVANREDNPDIINQSNSSVDSDVSDLSHH